MSSLTKSIAGVVLAVAIIAVPSYCAGRGAGERGARNADLDAIHDAEASLTRRQTRDSVRLDSAARVTDSLHAANDSLRIANEQLAARVAGLMRRVTVTSPTVIAVDTGAAPGSVAPVVVSVPPQVTGLVQGLEAQVQAQTEEIAGLRAENASLRAELVIADSGWTQAKALAALQQREIATINAGRPRFGFKTGAAVSALVIFGGAYVLGEIN